MSWGFLFIEKLYCLGKTKKILPNSSLMSFWSSTRNLGKPSMRTSDCGLCFLKKHALWNQFGCLPSWNADCRKVKHRSVRIVIECELRIDIKPMVEGAWFNWAVFYIQKPKWQVSIRKRYLMIHAMRWTNKWQPNHTTAYYAVCVCVKILPIDFITHNFQYSFKQCCPLYISNSEESMKARCL